MGITIHYRGKLNSPGLTGTICEELADIANEMDWPFEVYDKRKDQVTGITIRPHPYSEFLSFLFNDEGVLQNIVAIKWKDFRQHDLSHVSIKTQFAPVEIHIAVIKLLKYLKKKYINNLKVLDEGQYWDTGDENLLSEKISFLNKMMDKLEGALNEVETDENDTASDFVKKLEKLLLKKYGNNIDIKKINNPED